MSASEGLEALALEAARSVAHDRAETARSARVVSDAAWFAVSTLEAARAEARGRVLGLGRGSNALHGLAEAHRSARDAAQILESLADLADGAHIAALEHVAHLAAGVR